MHAVGAREIPLRGMKFALRASDIHFPPGNEWQSRRIRFPRSAHIVRQDEGRRTGGGRAGARPYGCGAGGRMWACAPAGAAQTAACGHVPLRVQRESVHPLQHFQSSRRDTDTVHCQLSTVNCARGAHCAPLQAKKEKRHRFRCREADKISRSLLSSLQSTRCSRRDGRSWARTGRGLRGRSSRTQP